MLVQHEPTARDLLRGRYSAGECRVLFPSTDTVTVAQAATSVLLRKDLDKALDDQSSSTARYHDYMLRTGNIKTRENGETIFAGESDIDRNKYRAGVRQDIAMIEQGAGE